MNAETRLVDELQAVASDVHAPPPPVATDLVRLARRQRARTRGWVFATTGLVAAAVVAAVVLGVQTGGPDPTPGPTHPTGTGAPLRTGERPHIPYIVADTLYIFDEPVSGTWWDVQTAQGSTVATRAVPPIGKPVLFRDLERTHLLDHAIGTARLSVDGTKLAWLERSGASAQLVVYDLEAGRELGRLGIDAGRLFLEDGTRERILWLADDGTVTHGGSLGVRSWRPGSPPTSSAAGLASTEGYPVDYTELAFSPDEQWAAWRSDRHGGTDATGGVGAFDGLTFESARNPDTRFTIPLPAGTDVEAVTWETATAVLVRYDAGRLLRCSVEERRCEYAPSQADP
jgi:hypothetical protein